MEYRRAMDLVAEAKERIENLSPAEVADELQDPNVVIVDLREQDEVDATGAIPGAIHAARGMLEFHADPSTPYHRRGLDPQLRTILYCSWGGRSALACRTLKELGYRNVGHMEGGLKAWAAAGYAVEAPRSHGSHASRPAVPMEDRPGQPTERKEA